MLPSRGSAAENPTMRSPSSQTKSARIRNEPLVIGESDTGSITQLVLAHGGANFHKAGNVRFTGVSDHLKFSAPSAWRCQNVIKRGTSLLPKPPEPRPVRS